MISQEKMMQELTKYAMEESRNRGLEEAAQLIHDWKCELGQPRHRFDIPCDTAEQLILRLRRNPKKHLSN